MVLLSARVLPLSVLFLSALFHSLRIKDSPFISCNSELFEAIIRGTAEGALHQGQRRGTPFLFLAHLQQRTTSLRGRGRGSFHHIIFLGESLSSPLTNFRSHGP